MKISFYFFALVSIFIATTSYSFDSLEAACTSYQGQIHTEYQCPKSRLKLPWNFCVFHNTDGIEQFFDGCTGPASDFRPALTPACIQHDLCYHHEPSTSGKTQEECDKEFQSAALEACENIIDNEIKEKCLKWSKTMYISVRAFGAIAYHCADIPLN